MTASLFPYYAAKKEYGKIQADKGKMEGLILIYAAFLTIIDPEKNAEHRPAHLEYINGLYLEGKVLMAGPFTDERGGLVLYKTDTYREAHELAEQDPVVARGARTLELREWKPLKFPIDLTK